MYVSTGTPKERSGTEKQKENTQTHKKKRGNKEKGRIESACYTDADVKNGREKKARGTKQHEYLHKKEEEMN